MKEKTTINEKIKAARQAETKREAALYAKRCEIVGAAILAEVTDNKEFGALIDPIVNARTTKPKDRLTFGLPPVKKN